MTLDLDAIRQFFGLKERLIRSGVIGIDLWSDEIHVLLDVLLDAENLKIEEKTNPEFIYPYKISGTIDGIKCFAMTNKKELSKFLERRGKGETVRVNG